MLSTEEEQKSREWLKRRIEQLTAGKPRTVDAIQAAMQQAAREFADANGVPVELQIESDSRVTCKYLQMLERPIKLPREVVMTSANPAKRVSGVGLVFALMTAFSKSTKLIVALKLMKFTKPLVTVVSMAISAVLYGFWLGPWFAVGLVAMLFIHELGHIIALRMKGYETGGPVFIPFVGAVIFAPKFDVRETEAFVGFGGPLLGTLGALLCLAAWPFASGTSAEILLLVSYLGAFLNLFNLIPISPLDGGRITQTIGGWFKYLGLGLLLIYTLMVRQPGLLLIWILVLEEFESLTLWLRPAIASVLAASMMSLTVLGYGEPLPWYLILLDAAIASAFTGAYWVKEIRRRLDGYNPRDDRSYPSKTVRTKWLIYYFGLVAVATLALVWQVHNMPGRMTKHSEDPTQSSARSRERASSRHCRVAACQTALQPVQP